MYAPLNSQVIFSSAFICAIFIRAKAVYIVFILTVAATANLKVLYPDSNLAHYIHIFINQPTPYPRAESAVAAPRC